MLLTDFIVATIARRMLVRKQTEIIQSAAYIVAARMDLYETGSSERSGMALDVAEGQCVFLLENQQFFLFKGKRRVAGFLRPSLKKWENWLKPRI